MFVLCNTHFYVESSSPVSNPCLTDNLVYPHKSHFQWVQKSRRTIVSVMAQIRLSVIIIDQWLLLLHTVSIWIYFCFMEAKSISSPSLINRVKGPVRYRQKSVKICKVWKMLCKTIIKWNPHWIKNDFYVTSEAHWSAILNATIITKNICLVCNQSMPFLLELLLFVIFGTLIRNRTRLQMCNEK